MGQGPLGGIATAEEEEEAKGVDNCLYVYVMVWSFVGPKGGASSLEMESKGGAFGGGVALLEAVAAVGQRNPICRSLGRIGGESLCRHRQSKALTRFSPLNFYRNRNNTTTRYQK